MFIFAVVVFLTLAISALCSLFEAALYSTRMATLEAAATEGRHQQAAQRLLEMKKKIAVPTAAILILNTVANTAGASIAGMYAAELFGAHFGHSAVYVFSGLLTVAILFLSEIFPKTFGATHWKTIWPWIVVPLRFLQSALAPAIWVSEKFTNIIARKGSSTNVTEDDILGMIRMGARDGELTQAKLRLLDGVFRFDNVVCRQVMDPRNTIVRLDASQPFSEVLQTIRETKHTRYPLCRGSLDEIIGVIHVKDLLGLSKDHPQDLTKLARPIERVPESLSVGGIMRLMQESQKHMAAVEDEHGTVTGIVTLEKILEQIVGDIQDEFDQEHVDIESIGNGIYRILGKTALERINRELDLELLARGVDTFSGYLVAKLGRIPKKGDRLHIAGAKVEVLEVSQNRAVQVKLTLDRLDSDSLDTLKDEKTE